MFESTSRIELFFIPHHIYAQSLKPHSNNIPLKKKITIEISSNIHLQTRSFETEKVPPNRARCYIPSKQI